MLNSLLGSARSIVKEFADLDRLFDSSNKDLRRLVFYGESGISYRYYEDYIEHILAASDLDICYLTSDDQDPILNTANNRIRAFYVRNTLSQVFARLDSRVLVIATPDLNTGVIKRAADAVHHVYAFRGIASTHQAYRLGAFNAYDSLLCIAPYQIAEVRKTEEIYNLRPKNLLLTGYPLVERIYREHQQYHQSAAAKSVSEQVCLVAPTWDPAGRSSIFDVCIDELIDSLAQVPYQVWIRPHPEYLKRFPKKMGKIARTISRFKNLSLQLELASMNCIHEADFLITDHSSISMDYVLGTERAVLFIDTPLRVDNPECGRLNLEPVENTYRSKLGASLAPDRLSETGAVLASFLNDRDDFRTRVPAMRDELLSNWQKAGEIGAKHILDLCS